MIDPLTVPVEDSEPYHAIHPAFDDRLLLAVERAARLAWKRMLTDKDDRQVLAGGPEPKITRRFRQRLADIRITGASDGYDYNTFERPHVNSEFTDYKGDRVGLPDLVFQLAGRPRPGVIDDIHDGIFVECKLIDNGSPNVGKYCDKGIDRYVDGKYAWRMPQGMMVAYVRTGQILPRALEDALAKYDRTEKLNLRSDVHRCRLSNAKPNVYLTEHDRTWLLPENKPPGVIQIRHLWLSLHDGYAVG